MEAKHKKCTKCQFEKSIQDFGRRRTGIIPNWCKQCFAEHNSNRYRSDPVRRKSVRDTEKKLIERNINFIEEVYSKVCCTDCGNSDRRVLDFDHQPNETKLGNVSDMVRQGFSLQKITDEIAKCDVRCANCHRIKTRERAGWR